MPLVVIFHPFGDKVMHVRGKSSFGAQTGNLERGELLSVNKLKTFFCKIYNPKTDDLSNVSAFEEFNNEEM